MHVTKVMITHRKHKTLRRNLLRYVNYTETSNTSHHLYTVSHCVRSEKYSAVEGMKRV